MSGALVAVPTVAHAADPFSNTSLYGTPQSGRVISEINPNTRERVASVTVPGTGNGVNQIGLSLDGNIMMLTDGTTVHRYTASTNQWASVARSTGTSVAVTMGGVDPHTGYLFFGGADSSVSGGETFSFVRYNPTTNTILPGVIKIKAAGAPGANGDLAFDRLGNMFFVAGAGTASAGAQIYRANVGDLSTSTTATASRVGGKIEVSSVNSIAFGEDGFLYLFGSNTFFKTNPITGAKVAEGPLNPETPLTDLGSRAVPRTLQLETQLPETRYDEDDEFEIVIGGGGITVGN